MMAAATRPGCPDCRDTRIVRVECETCAGSGRRFVASPLGVDRYQDCADCHFVGYVEDECKTCLGEAGEQP
jgi:DnaJ-class molecular chaperone